MKTPKFYLILSILIGTLLLSCNEDSELRPVFNLEEPDEISDEEYLIYSLVIEDYFSGYDQYLSTTNYIIRQRSWNLSIDIESASLDYFPETHTIINPEVFESFNLKNYNTSLFDNKFQVDNKEIVLISTAELQYVFNDVTAIQLNWENFFEHYKDSYGIIYLTRIGFNNDKTQALFEFISGSYVAEGRLFYLEKENAEWVLKDKIHFWAE